VKRDERFVNRPPAFRLRGTAMAYGMSLLASQ